jgi:nicotinamide-nucleotide amidase
MNAELLAIGSELTSGSTVNTNAAYLARRLAELGIRCRRQVTVGDEREELRRVLRESLQRCDLLIATGGLGPTFDDVTAAALAEAAGRPLAYEPSAAATVRRFYRRRHRHLQRAALRQAYVPQGALALPNPIGTAPGIWLALPRPLVIALPGVPGEMRAIMERSVVPRLKRLKGREAIVSRTLRTVGLVELSIQAILRTMRIPDGIEVGLYPNLRAVDIRLTARASSARAASARLAGLERALGRRLGSAVYGAGEETLEAAVGAALRARRKTLAVAESCTGGLLSDRITSVPGSSRYFLAAVVAYHNDIKRGCLGVSKWTLDHYGAVSVQAAGQMAQGVRYLTGADVGLSVTGIAGPDGGTARKPVGLVCLGLSDERRALTRRCQFFGDRAAIKQQAAQTALDWLRRYVLNDKVRS